jgi:hypothetical protein
MNPRQMIYAGDVLAAAILSGMRDSGGRSDLLRAYVFKRMEACVHHDIVDAGFRKRAELVDVRSQMEALA